jgi:glyoxylase-like metal-dependent hydrolase (beta-lactamase superfamily II)
MDILNTGLKDGIYISDCHYVRDRLTASFLLLDPDGKKENVIIETGHGKAVPHILSTMNSAGVSPESISLIFITHVHLDHCGGLGLLLEKCPNAKVVCHPRARLHLINPEKLINGTMMVYGEVLYKSLYGEILPVEESRIIEALDNEEIETGGRKFIVLHTPGHARHHICIHDHHSGSIFTGDTFGLAYPDFQAGSRKFIYPATTPSDFDLVEARNSIGRILSLEPSKIWLTHFGVWENAPEGADQLLFALEFIEKLTIQAESESLTGEELKLFCHTKLRRFIESELEKRNLRLTPEQWKVFDYDVKINSMGIAHSIDKNRKNITR